MRQVLLLPSIFLAIQIFFFSEESMCNFAHRLQTVLTLYCYRDLVDRMIFFFTIIDEVLSLLSK